MEYLLPDATLLMKYSSVHTVGRKGWRIAAGTVTSSAFGDSILRGKQVLPLSLCPIEVGGRKH